jgi:hypothetical protein
MLLGSLSGANALPGAVAAVGGEWTSAAGERREARRRTI